jgi:hypothetical protein
MTAPERGQRGLDDDDRHDDLQRQSILMEPLQLWQSRYSYVIDLCASMGVLSHWTGQVFSQIAYLPISFLANPLKFGTEPVPATCCSCSP